MSEPTLKQFLAQLTFQLPDGPIIGWQLAAILSAAYAAAKREADEERRLLTTHSEKGDVR